MRRQVPNILTVLRFPLAAVFLYGFFQPSVSWRLAATACFILSALTDTFDGLLARKMGAITGVGAFLDPLADKVLVLSGFFALMLRPDLPWGGWKHVIIVSVLLIALREVGITVLRWVRVTGDRPLVTSFWGKAKTTTEMVTLIVALLTFNLLELYGLQLPVLIHLVAVGVVGSALLAVYSGLGYLRIVRT
ncbi:MAG TPA: CDP-alcohol phosphatidyltransferase family protein [Bacteroidetes bacterium]|nr:CDP-alcohol phosphatidyltransferase family protein [Bacteroidota bacterium]